MTMNDRLNLRQWGLAICLMCTLSLQPVAFGQAPPSLKPDAKMVAREQARKPDPDRQAADLNARQRINQTFTVRRRAGDDVLSETTLIVPGDRDFARQTSEAGGTVRDYIRAAADATLLTRREAFTEAQLDFALLDQDRDGFLNQTEYEKAAALRRDQEAYERLVNTSEEKAPSETKDNRYAAFAKADRQAAQRARLTRQFTEMAALSGGQSIDQRAYALGILAIFDKLDGNEDGVLIDAELHSFRQTLLPDGN
ncbi:MAG: hypothetical protein AAFO78_10735 [Pseudomonadota bacterium]